MPSTEQIIIEFGTDYTQLDGAIDLMVKLGQVDKATADQFKKTSTEINARATALKNVSAAQTATSGENKKAQKSLEDLSKAATNASKTIQDASLEQMMDSFAAGVDDALKEAGISVDQFTDSLKDLPGAIEAPENKAITLKGQLRQLKEELSLLEAQGKDNTKEFEQMSVKAAQLEDQIGDTNARIRALASDTRIFDGISQGVSGVVAGFQAAEGAAFLFGGENKDLQETLVKLNAVMAVSNGLSQIQAVLQKESAAIALITLGQQKLEIFQTQLQTAAQSQNVIAKYAAIAAQRILNALQAASPAGLLLVTIGALAAAYALLSDNTEDAADKQININKAQEASFKTLVTLNDSYVTGAQKRVDSIENELVLAKARGESTEKITELELALLKAKKEVTDRSIGFLLAEKGKLAELQAQYESAIESLGALQRKLALDPENKDIQKQVEAQQGIVDNVQAMMEKLQELYKQQSEQRTEITAKEVTDQRKLRSQILTDQKAIDEALLLQAKEGSVEQKKLRQDIVKDQLAIDLAGENLSIAQRKLLTLRANAEILNIEKEFIRARNELFTKVDLNDIDARLAAVEKGSEAELILQKQKLDVEAAAEKQRLQETITDEVLLASELQKLNAETIRKKQDLDDKYFKSLRTKLFAAFARQNQFDQQEISNRLIQTEKGTLAELQLKKDAIESQADDKKLAIDAELISEEEKAAKIRQVDQETVALKDKADEQYNKDALERAEKTAEEQRKLVEERIKLAAQMANTIASAAFEIYNNNLHAETDAKLSQLNKLRDKELANENLTEAEKDRINERFRQKEASIKRRAFAQEKEAALLQAAIQGALAIITTFAEAGYPAGIPLAAAQAVATAAQIAVIASKPVPEFAKGTERVKGAGTRTSDSIHAMLSVDERVIPADVNMDYFQALSAIHNRKVSPKLANALLMDMPSGYQLFKHIPADYHIDQKDIEKMMVVNNSMQIDEDMLARKIAEKMDDRFYQLIDEVRKGNTSDQFDRLIKEVRSNKYNPFTGR